MDISTLHQLHLQEKRTRYLSLSLEWVTDWAITPSKQDRPCTYSVTLGHVRAAIVVVEKL